MRHPSTSGFRDCQAAWMDFDDLQWPGSLQQTCGVFVKESADC